MAYLIVKSVKVEETDNIEVYNIEEDNIIALQKIRTEGNQQYSVYCIDGHKFLLSGSSSRSPVQILDSKEITGEIYSFPNPHDF